MLLEGRLAAKAGHEALLLLLLLLLHGQVLLVLLHLLLLLMQLLLLLVLLLLLHRQLLLLVVKHRGQLARRGASLWRADVVAAGGAADAGRGGPLCRHQVLVIAVSITSVAAVGQQQRHGEGQLDGRGAALRSLQGEGRGDKRVRASTGRKGVKGSHNFSSAEAARATTWPLLQHSSSSAAAATVRPPPRAPAAPGGAPPSARPSARRGRCHTP